MIRFAAASALIALSLCACSDPGIEKAKAAALAQPGSAGLVPDEVEAHQRTGLKGTKAEVICGQLAKGDEIHSRFIYFAKVTSPGLGAPREGDLIRVPAQLGRQDALRMTYFCDDKADRSAATDWAYFN